MKLKKLSTIFFSLIISLGMVCSTGNNIVEAKSNVTNKQIRLILNSPHYHKVRLIKDITVRKIHWKFPHASSTLGHKKKLPKKKIAFIIQSASCFGWHIKAKGLHGSYTIDKPLKDFSWLSFNTKSKKKRHKSPKKTAKVSNKRIAKSSRSK